MSPNRTTAQGVVAILRSALLATGLQVLVTQFLDRVNELGVRIRRGFRIAVPA